MVLWELQAQAVPGWNMELRQKIRKDTLEKVVLSQKVLESIPGATLLNGHAAHTAFMGCQIGPDSICKGETCTRVPKDRGGAMIGKEEAGARKMMKKKKKKKTKATATDASAVGGDAPEDAAKEEKSNVTWFWHIKAETEKQAKALQTPAAACYLVEDVENAPSQMQQKKKIQENGWRCATVVWR